MTIMKRTGMLIETCADDAPSLEFVSDNTYLVEGVFSDSGFAGLAIHITHLNFIPYV